MIANRGLRRSFGDFKRHPWLHLVSILTIEVSLLILGIFFLCYRNFEALAEKTTTLTTGTVYLKESLAEGEVAALKERIFSMTAVKNISFKDRHSIMEELHTFLGSSPTEKMPPGELFPDVLEIEVKKDATAVQVNELKSVVSKMPEVSEVDFSEDWLAQFHRLRRMIGLFGFFLMTGVIIGCGFIIANFMGIRHQSRKNEIDIVRLHGAHRNFILAPFLWEGFIEGIIGSSLAIGSLYGAKILVGAFVSTQWANLIGMREILFLSALQVLAVVTVGIAMAFFGSITVFLRFQESSPR